MWQFIIPTLISTIGGAVSAGTQASQAERQNQQAAQAAAARRAQLQGLIDSIQTTDYRGLERAGSAQFSQAADQIEALTAGRNTFGAGTVGARNLQTQALSDILTNLGAQKNQDQLQRQQMVASLMGDPAFITPDPSAFNPAGVGLNAALGGGAAGLAQGAAAFFGTDVGQAWLAGLGKKPAAPAAPAPTGNFSVSAPGLGAQAAQPAAYPTYQPYVPVAQPYVPSPPTMRAPVQPVVPTWWGQSVVF